MEEGLSGTPKFIVSDVTYTMLTDKTEWGPEVRIWGRIKSGETICVKVRDFMPYFYFDYFEGFNRDQFTQQLKDALKKDTQCPPDGQFIKGVGVCQRTPIMGYRPKGATTVYQMVMSAPTQISTARELLESNGIQTYEASVLYVLRFMIDKDFGGCHWIGFNKATPVYDTKTSCKHEYIASHHDLYVDKDDNDMGKMRRMTFDIEACKFSGPGFVDPREDPVTQIGCAIDDTSGADIDNVVFCLVPRGKGVTTPLQDPKVRVETFESEQAIFYAWKDYIVKNEIDIITGYNIDGFDLPYLFERAKALKLKDEWYYWACDVARKVALKKAFFQSAAKGTREDYELQCEGRFALDTIKFVKEFNKLRSYSLANVSKVLLESSKVDMPYKLIPEYQMGTDDQRAHLAYYCWMDSKLCFDILEKRKASIMYIQNARVCGVPMKFLIQRGQQILSRSLLGRYCRDRGVIIPSSTESQNDEKTDGATVWTPLKGFYEVPIVTLDFQSLYPSCIRNWNICYSTKAPLNWAKRNLQPDQYYVPPIDGVQYCFVTEKVRLGILSEIEETLHQCRLEAKALMKQHKGTDLGIVYDKLQEAIKLRMNSLYGFLKANMVCDKDLMEAVTGWGRWMLKTTAELVEKNFPGSKVVYGDSVTPTTPVLIKRPDGVMSYINIEDMPLEGSWEKMGEKEYGVPRQGIQVWTDQGFTRVNRVIRHKTNKRLYRILTHTGCVTVTEDHSLLNTASEKVTPNEVKVGFELLHHDLPLYPEVEMRTKSPFYTLGLFYGDGSCGRYETKSGIKRTWAINNQNLNFLNRAKMEMELHYPDYSFKVLDTIQSSGVYKLVVCGSALDPFVREWRQYFYSSRKQKCIPDFVLNAPKEDVTSFLEGYYDADGDKDVNDYHRFDNKGEIGAAALLFLHERVGFKTSVNNRSDKLDVYRITCTKNYQRKNTRAIKRIEEMPPTLDYVYDLETHNHHFGAGVGHIIVHNTDSVFISFGDVSLDRAFELGQQAADLCTKFFSTVGKGGVHLLQREKAFLPFVLIGKKKYAGRKTLAPGAPFVMSSSGLETVRRDNAKIGSETLEHCLEEIIMKGDYTGLRAAQHVHQVIRDLKAGRIDMSQLIISKALSKSAKHYEESEVKQVHSELAKRIAARAPFTGETPYATGDRVKYVMIKGAKNSKNFERSEDPLYALKNRIPIDEEYYIENQMMKPLLRLFAAIVKPQGAHKFDAKGTMYKPQTIEVVPMKKLNKKKKEVSLNDKELRQTPAFKLLFVGDHMRTVIQKSAKTDEAPKGSILTFVKKQRRCLSCSCGYTGDGATCSVCVSDAPRIKTQLEEKRTGLVEVQQSCLQTCRECVKDPEATYVPCSNNDCDNFFRREKVQVDIEDLADRLALFK